MTASLSGTSGRAAVFRGDERDFDIVEHPLPDPAPGMLLLRMELGGICGTDVHMYEMGMPAPTAFGHENAGIVVALGEGVTHDYLGRPVRVGDRVVPQPGTGVPGRSYGFRQHPAAEPPYFTGGHGQYLYLCYPNTAFFRTDAPAETAVLLEPLTIAVHAVDRARPRVGDTVVVQGTGAIGLLCIFVARRAGAVRVIAVGGPAGRLDLAAALGADVCLNIAEVRDAEERTRQVLAQTPGEKGADVVIEAAGVKAAIIEGLGYLRRGGTFCELGHFIDTGEMTINPNKHLLVKDLTLVAPWGSRTEHFVRSLPLLEKEERALREMVSHRIPLRRMKEAFDTLTGRPLPGRDRPWRGAAGVVRRLHGARAIGRPRRRPTHERIGRRSDAIPLLHAGHRARRAQDRGTAG
jgi:threonine dehydrogenase-like Zn-dependent dehydrogenase